MKKIFVHFLLLCLMLLSLFACKKITDPIVIDPPLIDPPWIEPPAPISNKILFTATENQKSQLFTMNPDGSDIKQITGGRYWHRNGVWSPDTKQIICNTEERTVTDAPSPMALMDADGSNRRLLISNKHYSIRGTDMDWRPDGKMIAYSSLSGIFTFDLETNKTTFVISLSYDYNSSPIWDKKGELIYFISNRHDTSKRKFDIYSINPKTLEVNRITDTPDGNYRSPSISTTNEIMAYSSNSDIFIMKKDGRNKELIVSSPTGENFYSPKWSPDEKELMVLSWPLNNIYKRFLYTINIEKKSYKKIMEFESRRSSIDWSM